VSRPAARALAALLLAVSAHGVALAAEHEDQLGLAATIGTAYDDNAYRMGNDAQGAGYLSAELDLDYARDFGRRTRFSAEFSGGQDLYDRSLASADGTRIDAGLGVRLTPYHRGKRRLYVAPSLFYQLDRKAFVSRQSGIEIEDEADRFNYERAGLGLDVEYRLSRNLRPQLFIQAFRKNYLEDFLTDPLTDSLDHAELRAAAALALRHQRSWFTASIEYRRRAYDEKFPRARDGTEVLPFFPPGASEKPYEPLELTYRIAELEWEWKTAEALRLRLAYEFTDRTDEFLGYMSSQGHDFDFSLRWTIGPRWRLYFNGSHDSRRYDMARVNYDPTRERRWVTYSRLLTRLSYQVSPTWQWFVFYRLDDEGNPIDAFDYTRHRLGTGMHVVLR